MVPHCANVSAEKSVHLRRCFLFASPLCLSGSQLLHGNSSPGLCIWCSAWNPEKAAVREAVRPHKGTGKQLLFCTWRFYVHWFVKLVQECPSSLVRALACMLLLVVCSAREIEECFGCTCIGMSAEVTNMLVVPLVMKVDEEAALLAELRKIDARRKERERKHMDLNKLIAAAEIAERYWRGSWCPKLLIYHEIFQCSSSTGFSEVLSLCDGGLCRFCCCCLLWARLCLVSGTFWLRCSFCLFINYVRHRDMKSVLNRSFFGLCPCICIL